MKKVLCDIYKSTSKRGYYLYVENQKKFNNVPVELLDLLGDTTFVMTLVLKPGKMLARIQADEVIKQIADKGFYLQISKDDDEYMTAINRHNDKLAGI